jgi:hypothetical protein
MFAGSHDCGEGGIGGGLGLCLWAKINMALGWYAANWKINVLAVERICKKIKRRGEYHLHLWLLLALIAEEG